MIIEQLLRQPPGFWSLLARRICTTRDCCLEFCKKKCSGSKFMLSLCVSLRLQFVISMIRLADKGSQRENYKGQMMIRVILDCGCSRLKMFLIEMVLIKNICSLLEFYRGRYIYNNQWPDYILTCYFGKMEIHFCNYIHCHMKYNTKHFSPAL